MGKAARLQLSLSATDLMNSAGFLAMSDPFAIVTVRGDDADKNQPIVAGFTNVCYNCLDPNWSTVIVIEGYKFGKPFFIEVGIFDFNAKAAKMRESKLAKAAAEVTNELIYKDIIANQKDRKKFPHGIMGRALFEVGEVLGSRGSSSSKCLASLQKRKKATGTVSIHIESSKDEGLKGTFRLKLAGMKLAPNPRSISPFYELYRRVEVPTGDITWNNVFRSDVAKNNASPEWQEAVLDMEALCNGDLNRTLLIKVSSHKRSGKHRVLGMCKTTVQDLVNRRCTGGNGEYYMDLLGLTDDQTSVAGIEIVEGGGISIDPMMGGNIVVQDAGVITKGPEIPTSITYVERPSFVDYLNGDCKINLAVGIDFSATNGSPNEAGSLHYLHSDKSKMNDYQKALYYVGKILAPFDHDQKFPVWGFGAKFDGKVNNCFQCGEEGEVTGVKGMMKAYKQVFQLPFTMASEAIDMTDVIRSGASYASAGLQSGQQDDKLGYSILLILTAGAISQVLETKKILEQVAETPLSVVIVGIGNADFSAMEFLDDDALDPAAAKSRNERDITQFVRFNDYTDSNALTEAVLDEIPDQVVDYFYSRDLMPSEMEQPDDISVLSSDEPDKNRSFLHI